MRRRARHTPDAGAGEVLLLDGLAAALEAGLPTARALHLALEVSPGVDAAGRGWEDLRRAARHGHPLAPAWARLARQTGSPTLGSVARAWAVASRSGAPLASAVRTSAGAARERRRLERVVDVATAGARSTATVLGLLPLAGVGLAAVLDVPPSRLYGTPAALVSALCGLVLLGVGHLVVRRLVRRVLDGIA
ncbi:type II secretion system F family protein [Ornithinimicrobium sp. LYQ103]|uniref:type II secretion system F family protein n=1 Tax=Ornithinimicrobium sp. LYQ103 TaxID=3378796 RepID=UPI0038523E46